MAIDLENFQQFLLDSRHSERTISGYLVDLHLFARWFEQTNGEELTPQNLTPSDVREYKQFQLNIQKAKATKINRHLSALRAYGNWAKKTGQVTYNPSDGTKSVAQQPHAPKWLGRKEQAAIIREAERRIQSAKTEAGKRQAIRDHTMMIVLLKSILQARFIASLQKFGNGLSPSELSVSGRTCTDSLPCKSETPPPNSYIVNGRGRNVIYV
jgi:site-specific recombinase XerD